MRIRIDVLNGAGCVSVRIDGADLEDVRRLLGEDLKVRLGAYRKGSRSTVTPAIVERVCRPSSRRATQSGSDERWRRCEAMDAARRFRRDHDDD